jgi:hypothetical protein
MFNLLRMYTYYTPNLPTQYAAVYLLPTSKMLYHFKFIKLNKMKAVAYKLSY